MTQPDITVLIPNYNGAPYLDKTLTSLENQTYPNFLVYFVDDGSTDQSLEIAREWRSRLPNLKIYEFANLGITANWNRAIQLVTTHYFTLLHCDDEYEPTYLEAMKKLLIGYPNAAIAHCVAVTINEESHIVHSPIETYKKNRYFPQNEFCRSAFEEFGLLLTGDYINCPSVFYQTAAVQAVGLFNEAYQQTQDWEYWFRILLQGFQICGTRQALFRYRRHQSNATQTNRKNLMRYQQEYAVLQWAYHQAYLKGWHLKKHENFSILIKTVIVDITSDLLIKKKKDAQEKLTLLKNLLPSTQYQPLYWILQGMILLGQWGGLILQTCISGTVALGRYLPHQKSKLSPTYLK